MEQISDISAVILAGGLARRLNGVEKGLQSVNGTPLISHIVHRLSPQIHAIYLNINRERALYHALYPELPSYSDQLTDFQGPLSGMLSGFEQIDSEYLLFVPCDTPFLPHNLVAKLTKSLRMNHAEIAYAHDGMRAHPTIALIHHSVAKSLKNYLAQGERRVFQFFQLHKSVAVDFSEHAHAFRNFNSPEDFQVTHPAAVPLLAITGYSGTGKTTLLEKLIPALTARNINVGLIKHSHHNVDVDTAGKDSYRLRKAGANPTMVVCAERWALMTETAELTNFDDLVEKFVDQHVDLVLVEGFKHEGIPKIQLHRQAIDKPVPDLDPFTLATATDYPLERENLLDINNIEQIATFIQQYLAKKSTSFS